jgi:hypothetical protein
MTSDKTDDKAFKKLKQKVIAALDSEGLDVEALTKLGSLLVKVKAVELKMSEEEYGEEFG